MPETVNLEERLKLNVFNRETLIKGKPAQVACVEIGGQTFTITKGVLGVVSLEDEWYEDVRDPRFVIHALKNAPGFKPDIFTFWQRVPETEQRHQYHIEWESLAVLPITSFDHWWNKQIKGTTRNMIRKSQKAGVEVRRATFDDEFVRGMVDIFNEAPVRQGRRFWHYGKDPETVKRQFSRFLFREDLIGAYYERKLIGFVMLANAGRFGVLGQFISKIEHRGKAVNNALIAKTVEVCEKRQLPYLTYGSWTDSSLVDFKRHSGFEKMTVPRYFVPLSQKGRLGLKLGAHRRWREICREKIRVPLRRLRRFFHGLGEARARG